MIKKELEEIFRQWVGSNVKGIDMSASVDGKALRNVCDDRGNPLFMVNVFAHDIQMTLAQQEIQDKMGESTTFHEMLQGLFEIYPGLRILTGDAGFTGRDLCREITRLGRQYLVQIKGNQKNVQEVLKLHFEQERQKREADAQTTEKKVNGKTTVRELWVCDKIAANYIRDDLNFPGVQQAGHIRKTIYQDDKVFKTENWYGITSCTRKELAPEAFLDMVRKHWEIENGLHHVKDRSWFEDHQYSKDQIKGILGVFRNMSLNAMRMLSPPSQNRKRRKYDKSLPMQALSYLVKPLGTLVRLMRI